MPDASLGGNPALVQTVNVTDILTYTDSAITFYMVRDGRPDVSLECLLTHSLTPCLPHVACRLWNRPARHRLCQRPGQRQRPRPLRLRAAVRGVVRSVQRQPSRVRAAHRADVLQRHAPRRLGQHDDAVRGCLPRLLPDRRRLPVAAPRQLLWRRCGGMGGAGASGGRRAEYAPTPLC